MEEKLMSFESRLGYKIYNIDARAMKYAIKNIFLINYLDVTSLSLVAFCALAWIAANMIYALATINAGIWFTLVVLVAAKFSGKAYMDREQKKKRLSLLEYFVCRWFIHCLKWFEHC